MHISEGILPLQIAAGATAVTVPFVAKGIQSIKAKVDSDPSVKPLIGLVSAAVFVISALPLPAPTGTSAHPTAIAIAAIILGPWAAATVAGVVLMMQALFMAHGGVSAWGANTMNMGIFGALLAYGAYHAVRRLGGPLWLGLGLAGALGDLTTYLGTSFVMALALAGDQSILGVTTAIFLAFLPSLVVLLPLEVLFTIGLFNFVRERRPDLAEKMGMYRGGGIVGTTSTRRLSGGTLLVLAGVFVIAVLVMAVFIPSEWEGVDVAIVESKAEELGGTVSAPLLNITGDLQLFVFTLAGFIGGAAVGYVWRGMFGPVNPPAGDSGSTTTDDKGGPDVASERSNNTFVARVQTEGEARAGPTAGHAHGAHDHKHDHDEIAEIAQDDALALERERALGSVSARAKVIALGAVLLVNLIAPSWITPALIFIASFALLLRAGIPRGTVLKRLMVPWYFAAVAFFSQVFFVGQTELFHLGPAVGYLEGLMRGIQIASRIVGGTAAVLLVSMTTPVTSLLAAATWLRVPPLLVEIAALTYRYLFLLAEEVERIREAQKTRMGHSTWRNSIRSYGTLGGMVMVNSYDRAERVYQAMVLRGYKGQLPVAEADRRFAPADTRALMLILLGLGAALALGFVVSG